MLLKKKLGTSLHWAYGLAWCCETGLSCEMLGSCQPQLASQLAPHSIKQQDVLTLSLPFLMSYQKLLKSEITIQSLRRHNKCTCALVHPFPFSPRFFSVSKSEKRGVLWMKEKLKNLLPFPRMSEIQCLFISDEGKGFSQKAKCFGVAPIPWDEIKLSLSPFLFRYSSSYTWNNREWKRSHSEPFTEELDTIIVGPFQLIIFCEICETDRCSLPQPATWKLGSNDDNPKCKGPFPKRAAKQDPSSITKTYSKNEKQVTCRNGQLKCPNTRFHRLPCCNPVPRCFKNDMSL